MIIIIFNNIPVNLKLLVPISMYVIRIYVIIYKYISTYLSLCNKISTNDGFIKKNNKPKKINLY